METGKNRDRRLISTWLLLGVVMVLIQIMLGGVTRLTGSGLSITKWDIVTGTLPPFNQTQWVAAFDLYRSTPQYQQINEGMSLPEFRSIFWWEYIHRLWARLMGFVFVVPFIFFLIRGSLRKVTIRRLMVVVGLASLAAVFGWIMVASGLVNRPWVSAYKLTIHLSLGIGLFVYLFYTWIKERGYQPLAASDWVRSCLSWVCWLTVLQILLGGLVSGMKAALNYPTWPDMRGAWLPAVLLDGDHWNSTTFLFYEQSDFMPALVQFLHRNTAYLIFIVVAWVVARSVLGGKTPLTVPLLGLFGLLVVQLILGILTLTGSIGAIPVFFGTAHQLMGILFLTYIVYLRLRIIKQNTTI